MDLDGSGYTVLHKFSDGGGAGFNPLAICAFGRTILAPLFRADQLETEVCSV